MSYPDLVRSQNDIKRHGTLAVGLSARVFICLFIYIFYYCFSFDVF